MFGIDHSGSSLDAIAHIIQVALTPVFLLSGIATLLNVFSTRLSRLADRVQEANKALDEAGEAEEAKREKLSAQLADLHRRSVALDVAVVLSSMGGAATCGAVLAMFVSALGEEAIATVLFGLFALAVVCALGAIAAFTVEMMMAGGDIRAEVAQGRRLAILPSLRHRAKRGSL